jgi:hypothetical protein
MLGEVLAFEQKQEDRQRLERIDDREQGREGAGKEPIPSSWRSFSPGKHPIGALRPLVA